MSSFYKTLTVNSCIHAKISIKILKRIWVKNILKVTWNSSDPDKLNHGEYSK